MKDCSNSKSRKIRNDIIFIITLLFIAVLGAVYLFFLRPGGNSVKVTVDGDLYGVYSLNQDIVEDIYTGKDNTNLNRLIIKSGKAYIETATCPDGICVGHAPIFRDGESIVCLPNRVVVTVITKDSDGPDVVA